MDGISQINAINRLMYILHKFQVIQSESYNQFKISMHGSRMIYQYYIHVLSFATTDCKCLNGGACDTLTGKCGCSEGFSGDKCQFSKYVKENIYLVYIHAMTRNTIR